MKYQKTATVASNENQRLRNTHTYFYTTAKIENFLVVYWYDVGVVVVRRHLVLVFAL